MTLDFLDQAKQNLKKFEKQKILVVGDAGLDEYVMGDVHRISPEAPVPVVEVQSNESRLGLSGYVAENIKSLGGTPYLVSVLGEDETGELLKSQLVEKGVRCQGLVFDSHRPTTRKLRVMAGQHHIVRVDYEKRQFLAQELQEKLLKKVWEILPEVSIIILQDYGKGVVSFEVAQALIREGKKVGKPVIVDPYRSTPLSFYRDASLLTPNHDESLQLAGWQKDDLHTAEDYLSHVGQKITEKTQCEKLVITLGKQGMKLFEQGGNFHLPTYAREVFDVTGAGDTVIATLGLALGSGLSLVDACQMANFAAGYVVGQLGCIPCTQQNLLDYVQNTPATSVPPPSAL